MFESPLLIILILSFCTQIIWIIMNSLNSWVIVLHFHYRIRVFAPCVIKKPQRLKISLCPLGYCFFF
ncbi:hypothetical protein JHK82_023508 [Glycine max]|uniref:Uncharacterized protein n=1 Tax=Glycine max TaxID=3847 RepID=K7LAV8_SOYBN|nr:hypothetical protein JHK85_024068 [Glycine max]KAG5027656.1 hypothetical protein JHK86_023570 [Glycine max]KAG5138777.1 hypothetical protein JHK82_023508 [Glycine max]KAH1054739.1 hypothetical protein GYH30_023493 [Glycine max]KRH46855.1 hypothetical protein GLYMA_08G360300v4 [Glycine max]